MIKNYLYGMLLCLFFFSVNCDLMDLNYNTTPSSSGIDPFDIILGSNASSVKAMLPGAQDQPPNLFMKHLLPVPQLDEKLIAISAFKFEDDELVEIRVVFPYDQKNQLKLVPINARDGSIMKAIKMQFYLNFVLYHKQLVKKISDRIGFEPTTPGDEYSLGALWELDGKILAGIRSANNDVGILCFIKKGA